MTKLISANTDLIKANKTAIETNAAGVKANKTSIAELKTSTDAAIAENASKIAANAKDIAGNGELIANNASAINNNASAIADNATEITKLRTDLETAKSDLTAAYKAAIKEAIETSEGKITAQIAEEVNTINAKIASEVAAVNSTIEALTKRVATCEKDIKSIKSQIYAIQNDIEDIQEQITAILARIHSIAYVPQYSDGKAVMTFTNNGTITPGTATFDFELKPASTAAEVATVWQTALSMSAVYTITKASPETVALTVESVSAENGFLSVTVSGRNLKDAYFQNKCSANVRLGISDGNNDLTSEYIQMVPWTRDVISFADPKFKAYCVENFDTDGDGEISEDEAKAVTAIDASLLGLTSLVGIEYFSNLETIDVSLNKLTSLDLSHSPKLTEIHVNGNNLQKLDLSGLAALKTLDCSANKLNTLDVSESAELNSLICSNNNLGTLNLKNNKALTDLQCSSNNLTALDLRNNTALEVLYCRKNSLISLNVTGLPALKELDCSNTGITALNLYKNTLLENLYCSSNNLTSLGLTANKALLTLDCSKNALTSLDLSKNTLLETVDCSSNKLTSLDVSGNSAMVSVTCDGNAEMAKLWVKDAAQETALTIKKEELTTISYNDGGIHIPDANLKAYLLALFDDDEDGEISIAEAENVQNVNCSGRSISNIVGLQDCPNLKYLNLNGNNVSVIDLPNLQKLETIVAYGNPITKINVNNDIALKDLYLQNVNTNALNGNTFTITGYDQAPTLELAFAGTEFTTLNLTGSSVLTSFNIDENIQLTKLVASGNSLVTGVNVSTLTALTHLDLNACGLTDLNVDSNVELQYFDCSSNKLTALNVNNNVALTMLDCSDNQLSTIRVVNNTALDKLDVSKNNLLNVNVRSNTVLKTLNVSDNAGITALALGYNTGLETLEASNTALTDIDLSNNLEIKNLNLAGCSSLHILDVSKNLKMSELDINGSSVSSLRTIPGLPIIGQYVVPEGVKGVIYYSTGSVIKIVTADESEAEWGYYGILTGANSRTDGVANTNKIAAESPAAKWCRDKGSAWYLPALDELKDVYNIVSKLNETLSSPSVGGTQFSTGSYWSSTEYEVSGRYYSAWFIYFGNGNSLHSDSRSQANHVRAVRAL